MPGREWGGESQCGAYWLETMPIIPWAPGQGLFLSPYHAHDYTNGEKTWVLDKLCTPSAIDWELWVVSRACGLVLCVARYLEQCIHVWHELVAVAMKMNVLKRGGQGHHLQAKKSTHLGSLQPICHWGPCVRMLSHD